MMEEAVWHTWAPESSESEFPASIARITLHTTVVDARSHLAQELFINPLPLLVKHVEGVEEDWTVSILRANAERSLKGPRKLVLSWTAIHELKMMQGVAYRSPIPT
jgi:hypothetical protein